MSFSQTFPSIISTSFTSDPNYLNYETSLLIFIVVFVIAILWIVFMCRRVMLNAYLLLSLNLRNLLIIRVNVPHSFSEYWSHSRMRKQFLYLMRDHTRSPTVKVPISKPLFVRFINTTIEMRDCPCGQNKKRNATISTAAVYHSSNTTLNESSGEESPNLNTVHSEDTESKPSSISSQNGDVSTCICGRKRQFRIVTRLRPNFDVSSGLKIGCWWGMDEDHFNMNVIHGHSVVRKPLSSRLILQNNIHDYSLECNEESSVNSVPISPLLYPNSRRSNQTNAQKSVEQSKQNQRTDTPISSQKHLFINSNNSIISGTENTRTYFNNSIMLQGSRHSTYNEDGTVTYVTGWVDESMLTRFPTEDRVVKKKLNGDLKIIRNRQNQESQAHRHLSIPLIIFCERMTEEMQIEEVESLNTTVSTYRNRFDTSATSATPSLSLDHEIPQSTHQLEPYQSKHNLDTNYAYCIVSFDNQDTSYKPVIYRTIYQNERCEPFLVNEVYTSEDDCVICLSEEASVILLPCRHQCICYECFSRVDKCPICRREITKYIFSSINSFI